jgi:hypothetical protein
VRLKSHAYALATAIVSSTVLGACGDDPVVPAFVPPPATPLALDSETRGLYVHALQSQFANSRSFGADLERAGAVVLHAQIFGEYEKTQTGSAADAKFENVIDSIHDEDEYGALVAAAEREYVVLDLLRLDRQWLVDWEGIGRDSADNRATAMSFAIRALDHDGDYQNDMIESIVEAVLTHPPDSLIVGSDMERYYLQNPADWPYFVEFVRDLESALVDAGADVRLSVGINWSNFVQAVVPSFSTEGDPRSVEAVQAAWAQIIDPLYFDDSGNAVLDFYAFASVPEPSTFTAPADIPDEHYAGIYTILSQQPEKLLPVAWYDIGWPTNGATALEPLQFLERFLELNGGYGVDTELVSWFGYAYLLSGECEKYTSAAIGASVDRCFRGLYDVTGQSLGSIRDEFFAE